MPHTSCFVDGAEGDTQIKLVAAGNDCGGKKQRPCRERTSHVPAMQVYIDYA